MPKPVGTLNFSANEAQMLRELATAVISMGRPVADSIEAIPPSSVTPGSWA
jgi:hypothetical protein